MPMYGTNYEHPVFTLDGKNIIVDRLNEVDEFTLQGQNWRSIIPNWTADERYPAIAPNGTNIAYVTACSPTPQDVVPDDSTLMVANLGSPPADPCAGRQWNPPTWGFLSHPSWGPGTVITFAHQTASGLRRIAISNQAQQVANLLHDNGDQLDPVWAPSGFTP
jgi:hypothetical protein